MEDIKTVKTEPLSDPICVDEPIDYSMKGRLSTPSELDKTKEIDVETTGESKGIAHNLTNELEENETNATQPEEMEHQLETTYCNTATEDCHMEPLNVVTIVRAPLVESFVAQETESNANRDFKEITTTDLTEASDDDVALDSESDINDTSNKADGSDNSTAASTSISGKNLNQSQNTNKEHIFQTKALHQQLKQCIRRQILERRIKKGLGPVDDELSPVPQNPVVLSVEEQERKEKRKDANRLSARRYRCRKQASLQHLQQRVKKLQYLNTVLESEKKRLGDRKRDIIKSLKIHSARCKTAESKAASTLTGSSKEESQ